MSKIKVKKNNFSFQKLVNAIFLINFLTDATFKNLNFQINTLIFRYKTMTNISVKYSETDVRK